MKRPLGIVLSLALSLLLTLAGCSGGETASALPQAAEGTLSLAPDQPVHLAVVAGEAANSPTHDYTGEVLSSLLTTLCRQGGHLTLVEADGAPYLLYSEAVAAPDASLTGNKQDQIVQAQAAQAAAFLTENAVPKTAEVDFVAALDLAARGLQGQAGNRVLYAAFNGLSTAGPMDFTQNLLRADPEAVADALEAQGNLVDLSGVHVVLTGLGDVAGEQAPLTLSAKENLQAIWQAYLTRCGAASVTFPGEYSTGQAPAGAPAVTPVPVLQDEPCPSWPRRAGWCWMTPPPSGSWETRPPTWTRPPPRRPWPRWRKPSGPIPNSKFSLWAPPPASPARRPPARPSARPGQRRSRPP